MTARDLSKWWLGINLVGTVILSFAVVYAYVLARRGERGPLEYIPGLLLVILGLTINIFRHPSLVPLPFSKYALWAAVLLAGVGVVLLEIRWRRRKQAKTRK
jgi:hypothetical protein